MFWLLYSLREPFEQPETGDVNRLLEKSNEN